MNLSRSQRTVPALLQWRVSHRPDTPLLVCGDRSWSAREVKQEVDSIAGRLLHLGIAPGERVGLMASNREETVFCWLALAQAGATCVPVNTSLRGLQLSYVLNHSGVRVLITERAFAPQLADVEAPLGRLETLVFLGEKAQRPFASIGCHRLRDLQAAGRREPVRPVGTDQIAAILYTGGTTGPSKGVMSSHGQYYWWGFLMARSLRLEASDVWYTCLPVFHINAQGTFLAALLSGGAMVLDERFSASRYWDRVRACGASVASLLGTMAHILHEKREPRPEDRMHGLRTIFCPGMDGDLQVRFEGRFGARIVNAYGMTELNCVTTTSPEEHSPPGSMGKSLAEFQVRIVDRQGREMPPDEPGEITVRPTHPSSVMSGYFRMEDETSKAWKEGWFYTGDRAYRDSAGHFFFVDRSKDSIRRRGENISSFEVEQVVNGYQPVLECAAYPVPSELGEDDVMVSVVARPGCRVDPAQLIEWCRPRLAFFALPRYVAVIDALPKTAVGRVRKFKLRKEGVGESCWDREGKSEAKGD